VLIDVPTCAVLHVAGDNMVASGTSGPALSVKVTDVVVEPPRPGTCLSKRRLGFRIRPPKGVTAKSATIFVAGKKVKVVRGRALKGKVNLRGLPKGRFTMKIVIRTSGGRQITQVRRYRSCAPRRVDT
jgi:hypothetical protein